MKTNLTIDEIRKIGFDALNEKLGVDGTLRFMHMFNSGYGDYTKDRKRLLKSYTVAEIRNELKK